jgi:regulator of cell morphogenesis and NO signaling
MKDRTVREIAVANPGATRVFEKFGIDYCCGGQKPLTQACAEKRVDINAVIAQLEATLAQPESAPADWGQAELGQLIEHIVQKHHVYTRNEMARLEPLLAKVVGVHGERHPELKQIQQVFRGLAQELTMHMMKEENILFPYIAQMEQAAARGARPMPPMFGTVQNPVRMMMEEHDGAGEALRQIREASSDLKAPADACISYETLYRTLLEFEADLHQHIHLENNVLFPRAIQLEDRLNGR